MKAFVTGASGFIGRHLVQQLVDKNYQVYGLTRTGKGADLLTSIGANPVIGSIFDADSMRSDMEGSDVVFHCAGWYKIGSDEWMLAESVNVAGTRTVLRLAEDLGVPKIIHTSSATVFGDTRGRLVDESFQQGGPFLTEFERTKWLAHYKVAQPMINDGGAIVIVVPGILFGPEDRSLMGDLMRSFYQGKMPVVPGPEFTVSYVHVGDVAKGLILAAEKGRPGETYIVAGPAIPLGEMVDFWAQITGKPAPTLHIPARFFKPFAPLFEAVRGVIKLPAFFSKEAVEMINATYMVRGDKAKAELGWKPRTLHDGMSETFRWIEETTPPAAPDLVEKRRKIAALALLTAAILTTAWFLSRKRESED